jgi:hypothetical protein
MWGPVWNSLADFKAVPAFEFLIVVEHSNTPAKMADYSPLKLLSSRSSIAGQVCRPVAAGAAQGLTTGSPLPSYCLAACSSAADLLTLGRHTFTPAERTYGWEERRYAGGGGPTKVARPAEAGQPAA